MFPSQSDAPALPYPSSHPDKALLTICNTDPRDGLAVAVEPSLNCQGGIEKLKAGYSHSEMGTLM